MARQKRETRNGNMLCPGCERWLHPTRFYRRKRQSPNGTTWIYDRECRLCQQTKRVGEKNEDRPLAILLRRADDVARKTSTTRGFVLEDLNYWSLLPLLRASLTIDGLCTNCGHEFENEPDAQFDHREPPRDRQDFARLHARNITIQCRACNGTKARKPYAHWLDDQESARLSANAIRSETSSELCGPLQMTIDEMLVTTHLGGPS